MPDRKILTEVKYRDLADLIFILSSQATAYHGLDEADDLTINEFTEWLCQMDGSVELIEYIPRKSEVEK